MAVHPNDDTLVVLGSKGINGNEKFLWKLRMSDGGHLSQASRFTLGSTGIGEHKVTERGLLSLQNSILIAFKQESATMRDNSNGQIINYAGKMLVGSWDQYNLSQNWLKEQSTYFGYSGSLAYKYFCDTCANIYVGGAIDQAHFDKSSDHMRWKIAIARLTENGEAPASLTSHYLIDVGTLKDPARAPFVDNMHIDGNVIFGTTRTHAEERRLQDVAVAKDDGGQVYIWKFGINADGEYDGNTFFCSKFQSDRKKQDVVVGMRPILADNGDLHGVIQTSANEVAYFVHKWQHGDFDVLIIHNGHEWFLLPGSMAVFHGATTHTNSLFGSNTIYQVYTGGTKNTFSDLLTTLDIDRMSMSAVIDNNIPTQTCQSEADIQDVKMYSFLDISATVGLLNDSWQDNTLLGYSIGYLDILNMWDQPVMEAWNEGWCSSVPTISSTQPGIAATDYCTWWGQSAQTIDFTPNKAFGATQECTDAAPTWIYEIDKSTLASNADQLDVTLNSLDNKITIKPTESSILPGEYTITVNGYIPSFEVDLGVRITQSFQVTITLSPCADPTVPFGPSEDFVAKQYYYTTGALESYDPPAFVYGIAGCEDIPIQYTNQVLTSHSGFINDRGSGKLVTWQSNSKSDIGLYSLRIGAKTFCKPNTVFERYTLTVLSSCLVETYESPHQEFFSISIVDPCELMTLQAVDFQPKKLTYTLEDPALVFSHDEFIVEPSSEEAYLSSACGEVSFFATFDGEEVTTESEPLQYDLETRKFTLYAGGKWIAEKGKHIVELTGFLVQCPEVTAKTDLYIELLLSAAMQGGFYEEELDAEAKQERLVFEPLWLLNLQDQQIQVGQSLQYAFEEWRAEEKEKVIDVKVRRNSMIKHLTQYNQKYHAFIVDGDQATSLYVGVWEITVEVYYETANLLIDKSQAGVQVFKNSFFLIINEPQNDQQDQNTFPVTPIKPDGSDDDQTIKSVKKLPPSFQGKVIRESREKVIEQSRPQPYVKNYSISGVLQIGWDQQMGEIEQNVQLMNEKVAVNVDLLIDSLSDEEQQDQNETRTKRRRVLTRAEEQKILEDVVKDTDIYTDNSNVDLRLVILDAIDVSIEYQTDPLRDHQRNFYDIDLYKDLDFHWDIIDYNKEFIWLKTSFDNEEFLGSFDPEVYITVSFFGVNFFKNMQDVEISFGTKLRQPIFWQIHEANQQFIDDAYFILQITLSIVTFLFMFTVIFGGDILSIWMFLNSISLILHISMLQTNMTAQLHYFLTKRLDFLRLYLPILDYLYIEHLNPKSILAPTTMTAEVQQEVHLLSLCGYHVNFSQNLAVFIGFSILIALVLLFVGLIQLLQGCKGNQNQETSSCSSYASWLCNFGLRLLYQFTLEIWLCLLIHAKLEERTMSDVYYLLAIKWLPVLIFAILASLLTLFLLKRLFCCSNSRLNRVKRGRAQITTTIYKRGTFFMSFWSIRPLSSQAVASLEASNDQQDQDEQSAKLKSKRTRKGKKVNKIIGIFDENDENPDILDKNSEKARLAKQKSLQLIDRENEYSPHDIQRLIRKHMNNFDSVTDLMNEDKQRQNQSFKQGLERRRKLKQSQNGAKKEKIVISFGKEKKQQDSEVPDTQMALMTINEQAPIQNNNQQSNLNSQFPQMDQKRNIDFFEGGSQLKRKNVEVDMTNEAKMRIDFEEKLSYSLAYSTLFLGLKKTQEHSMAIVHPVTFVVRRILFAAMVVYMQGPNLTFQSVLIMLATCLIMLCMVAMEKQFIVKSINVQHLLNETVFYTVCVLLLPMSGVILLKSHAKYLSLAIMLITCIFIAFNLIFILISQLRFLKLVCKRYICKQRRQSVQSNVKGRRNLKSMTSLSPCSIDENAQVEFQSPADVNYNENVNTNFQDNQQEQGVDQLELGGDLIKNIIDDHEYQLDNGLLQLKAVETPKDMQDSQDNNDNLREDVELNRQISNSMLKVDCIDKVAESSPIEIENEQPCDNQLPQATDRARTTTMNNQEATDDLEETVILYENQVIPEINPHFAAAEQSAAIAKQELLLQQEQNVNADAEDNEQLGSMIDASLDIEIDRMNLERGIKKDNSNNDMQLVKSNDDITVERRVEQSNTYGQDSDLDHSQRHQQEHQFNAEERKRLESDDQAIDQLMDEETVVLQDYLNMAIEKEDKHKMQQQTAKKDKDEIKQTNTAVPIEQSFYRPPLEEQATPSIQQSQYDQIKSTPPSVVHKSQNELLRQISAIQMEEEEMILEPPEAPPLKQAKACFNQLLMGPDESEDSVNDAAQQETDKKASQSKNKKGLFELDVSNDDDDNDNKQVHPDKASDDKVLKTPSKRQTAQQLPYSNFFTKQIIDSSSRVDNSSVDFKSNNSAGGNLNYEVVNKKNMKLPKSSLDKIQLDIQEQNSNSSDSNMNNRQIDNQSQEEQDVIIFSQPNHKAKKPQPATALSINSSEGHHQRQKRSTAKKYKKLEVEIIDDAESSNAIENEVAVASEAEWPEASSMAQQHQWLNKEADSNQAAVAWDASVAGTTFQKQSNEAACGIINVLASPDSAGGIKEHQNKQMSGTAQEVNFGGFNRASVSAMLMQTQQPGQSTKKQNMIDQL